MVLFDEAFSTDMQHVFISTFWKQLVAFVRIVCVVVHSDFPCLLSFLWSGWLCFVLVNEQCQF